MSTSFNAGPVAAAVATALATLEAGRWRRDQESALVDLKEEGGRRAKGGSVRPGSKRSDEAARQVAAECACMANTPGGGALILGAADDGDLIGTELDVEWLRHRVYELTGRALTISATPVDVRGVRLLVITSPEAIEPIRFNHRITWRVGDHCVEVDAATWHHRRMLQMRFDWSAQESNTPSTAAREGAVDIARDFLRASGESHAQELVSLPTPELLRRLNVVTADGYLTNAGVIAFVGRGDAALDYIRRDYAGADSRARVRSDQRSVLEELQEVLINVAANTATQHLRRGAVEGQVKEIPERAAREAIVNGLAHREWSLKQPTVLEHIGRTLRVTSPGGFFGGVNPDNIITHPSESRNPALTELFARIRVAEREGVGVDRMVAEMLRLGHEPPEIVEIDGPYVRTALVGEAADLAWIEWLSRLQPADTARDLNALLLLRRLVRESWVDISVAARELQLDERETAGALRQLSGVTMAGGPVLRPVALGTDELPPSWALSSDARQALEELDKMQGHLRTWPNRRRVATTYARVRGRISTTELATIVGAHFTNVGGVLKELESNGILKPSRANRRGPGFYYVHSGALVQADEDREELP